MKLIKNICMIGVAATLLSGCRGDLMDLNPYSSISSGNMWTSENLADMGVTGIYNLLLSGNVAGDLYKFECFGVSADCRDRDYAITLGNITTSDGLFSGYWTIHYEGVSRCNDAIANLPNAPLDDAKRNRLMAESKFMRAFFYYKLNSMFKGVPLYTEPTELDDFTKGRNTEAEVWDLVIQDLTDAINTADFPDKYEKGSASFGRATKGAAYALRGKAYMWMNEWAKAEADFRKVGELGYALFDGEYKQFSARIGADTIYADADFVTQGTADQWVERSYRMTKVSNTSDKLYMGYNSNDADFYIDNVRLVSSDLGYDYTDETQTLRYYAEKCGKKIGVAIPLWRIDVNNENLVETATVSHNFNMVVAENEMKVDAIQPNRGEFNFYAGDCLVSLAERHDMEVRGHTLVWHKQLPAWISSNGIKNDHNYTREELLQILKEHVTTVVTHFKGHVDEWDVVNECLDDDQSIIRTNPTGYKLRESVWATVIGCLLYTSDAADE